MATLKKHNIREEHDDEALGEFETCNGCGIEVEPYTFFCDKC